jgi:hypothetical protein
MKDADLFAEACLALAADKGWRGVSLFDIAARAGQAPADLCPRTPADAYDTVEEYFDRAAATNAGKPDSSTPTRDRVFDAAMARFEAMERQRAGVLALDAAIERDPIGQAAAFARAGRSARWLLALAGESAEGASPARVQALAIALTQARAAWRGDEAGDFARTMAALDRALRRAESFFDSVGKFAGAFKPQATDAGSGSAKPEA